MVMTRFRIAILILAALLGVGAHAQDPQANSVTGSGKTDYVPLWTGTTKLGDSVIYQKSSRVGIGTTTPAATLDVDGTVNAATQFNLGGLTFAWQPTSFSLGIGTDALHDITAPAVDNTAVGSSALQFNSTGVANTAVGSGALRYNTGGGNTAVGSGALSGPTTGTVDGAANTAIGEEALTNNTSSNNAALGAFALKLNTTGTENTASGYAALASNTTGEVNDAHGFESLYSNTTGNANVAMGWGSLYFNVTGSGNTALGVNAGPDSLSTNLTNSTAIGYHAVVSESNALVLGGTGTYAVKVGIGTATPSNVFTIAQGAGQAMADGWLTYSSRRFKTNIQTLHNALQTVEQLRGVSYDQKTDGKRQIGVIAEEVGAVVPEVVSWENNGKDARSVDYSRLTALLIEATKEQQTLIHQQQEQLRAQQTEIEALASQVKIIRSSVKTGRANSPVLKSVSSVAGD